MKFYTLDFDCNAPVTQQVNVPTNTDYKVGIKVKRNGAYQNLKPAEVTLGTLSADEGDVNGYTTFTMSAGDTASYTQATLDIQHAQDSTVEIQKYTNETGAQVSLPLLSCTAEELGLAGKTIYPDMVKMGALFGLNAQPTDAELKAAADTYWNWTFREDTPAIIFRTSIMISGSKGTIYSITGDPQGLAYKQALKDEGKWDGVTPIFFFVPAGEGSFTAIYDYTFDGSETIAFKNVKTNAGKSKGGYLELDYDLPFDAKFKLNTNIFKSQQGDKAESINDASTAKLTGVYSDGTEFDYDVVIA